MKPTYRQSNLVHYFDCPKRFHLSMQHKMEQSSAMEDGLLFESLVFGVEKEEKAGETQRKRRQSTVDVIEDAARYIKKNFFLQGTPFVKMTHECKDYILQGEADFIGTVDVDGEEMYAIADLKYTGDIERLWNKKHAKHEYFQAVMYPYLHYQTVGEILPFVYFVVESKHTIGTKPIVKKIVVKPSLESFDWLLEEIDKIHGDVLLESNLGACIDRSWRCPFLENCESGRRRIAPTMRCEFMDFY